MTLSRGLKMPEQNLMASQTETNLTDRQEEAQLELEGLKREYERRVERSKLGRAEKAACLEWLQKDVNHTGQPIAIKDLETSLEHFSKTEEASLRLAERYREKVEDFIRRGLLSQFTKDGKDRLQAELGWFTDLAYEDPSATIDKRRALLKSDIDDPERMKVKEAWDHLPRVYRERYGDVWNHTDLDGRKKLAYQALERHKALKARFLKLPPEIQEQRREEFKKIADFDQREIFLIKIEEALKKQEEQKQREGVKNRRDTEHHSQRLPAGQIEIKAPQPQKQEKKEGALSKAKAWFLKTLRALALSSNPSDAEAIETYAISGEVKKRRKRAEVEFSAKTVEALKEKSAENAKERDPFANELVIKTQSLREHRAHRQIIKRALRPLLQDTNAVLTHAKLVNDQGRELTADEFGQTELLKQRAKVEETVLRHAPPGAAFDASTLEKAAEEISREDFEAASRESIRKAA